MMTGTQREERKSKRVIFTAPAVIYVNGVRHLGLVRDFSVSGMFIYTNFQPACGDALNVTVKLTRSGSKMLTCQGRVTRVATGSHGAAIGVAIQSEQFQLTTLRQ